MSEEAEIFSGKTNPTQTPSFNSKHRARTATYRIVNPVRPYDPRTVPGRTGLTWLIESPALPRSSGSICDTAIKLTKPVCLTWTDVGHNIDKFVLRRMEGAKVKGALPTCCGCINASLKYAKGRRGDLVQDPCLQTDW